MRCGLYAAVAIGLEPSTARTPPPFVSVDDLDDTLGLGDEVRNVRRQIDDYVRGRVGHGPCAEKDWGLDGGAGVAVRRDRVGTMDASARSDRSAR